MKLVLGSVQFGKNYGLVNGKKIPQIDIKKISNLVVRSKIDFIDTSINYGDSEKIIGNSVLNQLNIITKIKLPKKSINIDNWVKKKINSSLTNLKISNVYGVLIHDYKDLLGQRGKKYLKILYSLKKKKIINKIGISIYSPNDLQKIWVFWRPDIVQVPFNILDQRILYSGWLNILKKNKVLIFSRSCFLQGLLLSNYKFYRRFNKFYKILDKFSNWCKTNRISKLEACISFVKKIKEIDYLIVGFNNYYQFKEILKCFNKKNFLEVPNIFSINDEKLIDPRKWLIKKKKF